MTSPNDEAGVFDAFSVNPGAYNLDEVIAKSLAGLIAGLKMQENARANRVSAQGFRDQVMVESAVLLRTYNGQPISDIKVLGELTLGEVVTNDIWPATASATASL